MGYSCSGRDRIWQKCKKPNFPNKILKVVEKKLVPIYRNILKGQLVDLEGCYSRKRCSGFLRWIELLNKENNETTVHLANHFDFDVTTILAAQRD